MKVKQQYFLGLIAMKKILLDLRRMLRETEKASTSGQSA